MPMTCARPPHDLSIMEVCRRCREETERYRRHEPHDDRYCWEMFRRAVRDRDDACWQAMTEIYHSTVTSWCRRAGADPSDVVDLVIEVWARFWQHFTLEKLAPDSGAAGALQYLKMCARSVVMDQARARRRHISLESAAGYADAAPTPADAHADQAARAELWRIVERHVRTERERVLVHLAFVIDMKPAEIAAARPDLFASVREVYSTTRNLLDRLRRSDALRAWLTEGDG
jgi:RNA polymerase sigma factor (sigma-70 family)